ncbi:MAG: hypothetical protein IMF06_01380 [Proteobacteria bacterium]|nr:hypothetical protein [Pseudomonadota bacterium]
MPDSRKIEPQAISIVQRGNLKALEKTMRKQWRLGQNIVLCWSADKRGLLVLFVPHYFLGNYCAVDDVDAGDGIDNEAFIRELVSGERRKTREELFAVAARLDVSPTFIKLSTALSDEATILAEVEQLIRRYGISYVESRAVLLFDITGFSLRTPFEQASQLNSLSYSMNSAYNKLLTHGIEINFARTTTGDGYYVWNRDLGPRADRDLFCFMVLVVADNAVARAASKGNTTPTIRTVYHIGSHYELYQAEGINPTMFSYIVGDVTIELARMVDLIEPHQLLMGDFSCEIWDGDSQSSVTATTQSFVEACDKEGGHLAGIQLAGKKISSTHCYLTEGEGYSGETTARRFKVTDKHGLSRHAFNLQLELDVGGDVLSLGLGDNELPGRACSTAQSDETADQTAPREQVSTEDLIVDLASLLKKRSKNVIIED